MKPSIFYIEFEGNCTLVKARSPQRAVDFATTLFGTGRAPYRVRTATAEDITWNLSMGGRTLNAARGAHA